MQKKWLLLSFVEGAVVMSAELCGAKLLAPVFGSSLYVWASVMGFTLFALAAGYFFGGTISSRNPDQKKTLRILLSVAALVLIAMPLIAHYLVPRLSYLPFTVGMVLSTSLLLLPPVFLLGASSPLFILLQVNDQSDAGKVSGTVYAVSTAGGIIATFLCGFLMIPDLGLSLTLLLFGLLLYGINAWVFRNMNVIELIVLLLLVYMNYQVVTQSKQRLVISDSILGRMEVFDMAQENDSVRYLTINDIIQSEMSLKTKHSVSPYIQLLDTLVQKSDEAGEKALVLGLGAGLTANMLHEKGYQTTGVEFDERISQASADYFFLSPHIKAVTTDARQFLNVSEEKYKIVLADLFKAEEQPSHVLTLESLINLKKNLDENGSLYITWHGYSKSKRGRGTAILFATLRAAGFKVQLCSRSNDEDFRNIIFVAALGELPELKYSIKNPDNDLAMLNTDDCPRLEKYNAEANKSWRASYLRYYQSAAN